MKIHHLMCASFLASVALASMAQSPPARREPQAATAAVPPLAYHSAFETYTPSNEVAPSPDKAWMAANQKAGNAGGHGGHGAHAPHPAPAVPGATHAHPGGVHHEASSKPRKEGK